MNLQNVNHKRKYVFWDTKDIEILKKEYPSSSKTELERLLNRKWRNILSQANQLGIHRNQRNKEKINGKCEKLLLDTPESFYWMGFLLADGYFSKNNRLCCTLSILDKNHLQKLADFLESSLTTYVRKTDAKEYVNLSILDNFNVNKIKEKFDIHNQKTYIPPNLFFYNLLSTNLFLSLIIGFIDGDGCIIKGKNRKTPMLCIKLHSSWLGFLKLINNKISELTKQAYPSPKINNQGYARLFFTHSKAYIFLKKKAIELNLPILNRKWNIIDEHFVSKYEKANKNWEKISKLLKEGRTVREIENQLNIKYSTLYTTITHKTKLTPNEFINQTKNLKG